MPGSAGVVLVGGRSSRMGSAKAALEWHGSTLLWRTVCVLERATGGPVVVVRAPDQDLPAVPPSTEIVADPSGGLGPVQGVAAGLAALAGRADVAFVAATDLPFLHPAFIRRVVRATLAGADIALPIAHGFRQPLAAAYRTALAPLAGELVAAGMLRPAHLFARCEVAMLDEAALLADPILAATDPGLDSVVNVNDRAEYEAARSRLPPEIRVRAPSTVSGPARSGGQEDDEQLVRAATVAEAANAAAVALGGGVTATVNGEPAICDGQMPLVSGDTVAFLVARTDG